MNYLIIHHEAPPTINDLPRFKIVNDYHKQKGFPKSSLGYYCGYHYFIEKTGILIKARQDNEIGSHTIGYNNNIGICLAGNFDIELPTLPQTETLKNLLKEKVNFYNIPLENIVPHRKFANKSCYGSKLSDSWAKDLLIEDKKLALLKLLVVAYKKLIGLLKI